MPALNYHHLRQFHAVAQEGSLTRAARRLNVSASALSVQIAALEAALGQALFDRAHRRMSLTEAGRIALAHADTIFRTGEELVSTLSGRRPGQIQVLRVGAQATLSRNFQIGLLRPLLAREDVHLVLRSASLAELLAQLEAHTLDLVLSTQPVQRDGGAAWRCRVLAEMPASIVGPARLAGRRRRPFRFPRDLEGRPLLLPGPGSAIRSAFDQLLQDAGVVPRVVAEVDDMAMLRLMAREGHALALLPPIVVQDELADGRLQEICTVPGLGERFFGITADRRFPSTLLAALLGPARR